MRRDEQPSPSSQSNVLFRYTTFDAAVGQLKGAHLLFSDPNRWDDLNDVKFLERYRDCTNLKTLAALCFTQESEHYHHWRAFGDGKKKESVCIVFNRLKLLEYVRQVSGIIHGSVKYYKIKDISAEPPKTKDLPFKKRWPYRDEREYRILYESLRKRPEPVRIKIPLAACIREIKLSPWVQDSDVEQRRKKIKSIQGCGHVRVYRTTVLSNQKWIRWCAVSV